MIVAARKMLVLGVSLFVVGHNAIASDDEIATDRPDFVESSNVVGKARFQVETSMGLDRDKSDGVTARGWSTPTLLRYGVSDDFEVRLETDGAIRTRISDGTGATERTRGAGDVSLGVKWHALDAEGNMPSVGVLVHADLATGSSAFRGRGTRPSARVVAEWELASDYSLGMMPGLGHDRDAGGAYGIFGIVVGKSLSDRLRTFVELSAPRIAATRHGGTEAAATVGMAYLLSKSVQLDTAVSRGLTRYTPDLSVTVGFSFKL